MYSRIEKIDPLLARLYLTKNEKNRVLKPTAISRYARDMKNGKWQLTPQGISFYENGKLADGQNRLNAIIEANVPVEMYVTYDVPNECTVQDRGVTRSTSDILHMAGITSNAGNTNGVALVNCLFSLANMSSISDNTIEEFVKEHDEQICKAISATTRGYSGSNKRICKKASLSAAAFCALECGLDESVVNRFFSVANTGFQENASESAAIVLRNALIQGEFPSSRAGIASCFTVATNAIRDFAQGVPRTRIYKKNAKPAFWKYTKEKDLDKYIISYYGVNKRDLSHYISAGDNALVEK